MGTQLAHGYTLQTHGQDKGYRAVPGRGGHAAGVPDRGHLRPGQVRAPAPRHRLAHAAAAQGGTRYKPSELRRPLLYGKLFSLKV